jgi:hypothetical protein
MFTGTCGSLNTDAAVEQGGGADAIKGVVEGAVGVAKGAGVVVGADDANES